MITLSTLRDLTLSVGALAVAALAADELTDHGLRRSYPLPPAPHGWLYTPNSYGPGVRRLRPATAQEDDASARSWDEGDGAWIGLGPAGEIYSLTDSLLAQPGVTAVYVSDRPALDPNSGLRVQLRRLTGQLHTLARQRTALAATRLGYWRSTDIDPADSGVEWARLTADVVALTRHDGQPHVLLIRRGSEPYAGMWALPGGHVDPHETTVHAARRELAEETGIHAAALHPVGTYTTPGRDPRGRYITTAYRTDLHDMPTPTAADDAAAAQWVPVTTALADGLAFDHAAILADALAWTPAPIDGVDALLDEADTVLVQGLLTESPDEREEFLAAHTGLDDGGFHDEIAAGDIAAYDHTAEARPAELDDDTEDTKDTGDDTLLSEAEQLMQSDSTTTAGDTGR